MIEFKTVDTQDTDHPPFVCIDADDVVAIGGPPHLNSNAQAECVIYLRGGFKFLCANRSYAEMVAWRDNELNSYYERDEWDLSSGDEDDF